MTYIIELSDSQLRAIRNAVIGYASTKGQTAKQDALILLADIGQQVERQR